MARTQRNPHELHADAARQVKEAASTDAARTLHDHAWQAHMTASLHHAHAGRNEVAAAQMRQMAGHAQSRRRATAAAEYNRLADEYDRAAAACRDRASHHHQRGADLTVEANRADQAPEAAVGSEPLPQRRRVTEKESA